MIIECNNNLTDENAKRKIPGKIDHMDEKIQALRKFFLHMMKENKIYFFSGSLTVFYCSGRYISSPFHNLDFSDYLSS